MTAFRDRWIYEDGFPFCDTCGEPAVFSEYHGNLHVTESSPHGVMPHADRSGHVATITRWAEERRRRRAAS